MDLLPRPRNAVSVKISRSYNWWWWLKPPTAPSHGVWGTHLSQLVKKKNSARTSDLLTWRISLENSRPNLEPTCITLCLSGATDLWEGPKFVQYGIPGPTTPMGIPRRLRVFHLLWSHQIINTSESALRYCQTSFNSSSTATAAWQWAARTFILLDPKKGQASFSQQTSNWSTKTDSENVQTIIARIVQQVSHSRYFNWDNNMNPAYRYTWQR